ncbi:NfeD family protein [Primorskyibacter sp. 2E233]|uniref:NfeD family protein n=1 Tax=Primorskyibacter sp. 2E233 TaxID=3413431 RepID=UPI003BF34765
MMWALWWVWIAAALALGILEMLVPAFLFLGFALGAGLTGLTLLFGGGFAVWLGASLPRLLVYFAVLSLIGWLILRKAVGVRRGQVKIWDRDIND